MTYGSDPLNRSSVMEAIQSPTLRGYLVDRSVPWTAVDLPLVTSLPLAPKDRDEVNLIYDETNGIVLRMLYRSSVPGWVSLGFSTTFVSTLPTAPFDGQEVYYLADSTNGFVWHLRYRLGSVSTYKWEYLGGSPLIQENDADETRAASATSATFGDAITTPGPTVTVPLAGDYMVSHGCRCYVLTLADGARMSYAVGATVASTVDCIEADFITATLSQYQTLARTRLKTAVAAASAITCKYASASGAGTPHYDHRWLNVTPVRVI